MKLDSFTPGIVLLCDAQGTILKIIQDTLGLAQSAILERPLPLIVDRDTFQKSVSFLEETRFSGTAFDWTLNLTIAGEVTILHFAGLLIDDHLLIMAAKTHSAMQHLYEELMRLDDEPFHMLRQARKTKDEFQIQTERDGEHYNEISRLNNELINLHRELAQKNAKLEQLNQQKNQFLGMAAHDLRNSLGINLAYSQFLLDEVATTLDDEHLEFIRIIRSSSEFMLGLVNNLLDITALESGKLQLDLQPVDLISVIERNVALNRVLAAKKQADLHFYHQGDDLQAMADILKLEQVLNNLISNAVKFSMPQHPVEVRLVEGEGQAIVSVRDQGQGIPADELDRLFKPFGKTSVRSTAGEKSTGLGLAIVRKIVEAHHGKIWVESDVGKGSTFYFSLPLVENG